MSKLFTAKEARELSGLTLEEKIESLLEMVKIFAQRGKRKLRTGYDHNEDYDLWIQGGYDGSEEWKKAKIMLEDIGYAVTFYYKDRSIAVDMYTVIEW